MAQKGKSAKLKETRRRYTEEFKNEVVPMLLDGHTAPSVTERLGLPNVNMLYRWKKERIASSGVVAGSLEASLNCAPCSNEDASTVVLSV